MILLTLDNHKVYAGLPLAVPHDEPQKWLRFAIHWSGFRDKNRKIDINADYASELNDQEMLRNAMLIPVEKIASVQPFDIDIFRNFNPPPD